jgi:hypothetical protein
VTTLVDRVEWNLPGAAARRRTHEADRGKTPVRAGEFELALNDRDGTVPPEEAPLPPGSRLRRGREPARRRACGVDAAAAAQGDNRCAEDGAQTW